MATSAARARTGGGFWQECSRCKGRAMASAAPKGKAVLCRKCQRSEHVRGTYFEAVSFTQPKTSVDYKGHYVIGGKDGGTAKPRPKAAKKAAKVDPKATVKATPKAKAARTARPKAKSV